MYTYAPCDLFDVKKVLETSNNCLNAIVTVMNDDSAKIQCLRDIEKTKNAISTINKMIKRQ